MKIDRRELDSLCLRLEEIAGSEKNRNLRESPPRVQVMVGLGRSFLARHLGYSMTDYYESAETRLFANLKCKLFLADNFADDTVIEAQIGYDYGAAGTLEAGLFGVPPVFEAEKDPYVAMAPVIKQPGDLGHLKIPDFYDTPPMPHIHKLYKELKTLAGGRLPVTFPGWVRGPWSIACFLRGFTELYMDVMDRPEFVKELLDFIAEARISWEKQRSRFLGLDPKNRLNTFTNCYDDYRRVHVSDHYSDEVDGALLSPEVYRDVVFPSEKKIADFYGGARYYHSCGNLTPLLETLSRLPGLRILHISSWTDLKKAYESTNSSVILQRALHPKDDVLNADEDRIRRQVREILQTVPDRGLLICADALYDGDMDAINRWLAITKDEVRNSA
jgi:hypothetical protein